MKSTNVIITNILILAAGILFLLVFRRESVMEWIIILSGALFAVTGLINVLVMGREANKERNGKVATSGTKRSLGWLCGLCAIILGVIMVILPSMFVSLFVYIFAIIFFVGGCYHVYMLARGMRPVSLPFWTYILPVVLIGGSVYMFFTAYNTPHESQNRVLMMSGIGLIIFAVTSFIELIGYGIMHKSSQKVIEEKSAIEDQPKIAE